MHSVAVIERMIRIGPTDDSNAKSRFETRTKYGLLVMPRFVLSIHCLPDAHLQADERLQLGVDKCLLQRRPAPAGLTIHSQDPNRNRSANGPPCRPLARTGVGEVL